MEAEPNLLDCQLIKPSPQIEMLARAVAQLAIGRADMSLEADSIWRAANGTVDILIAGICEVEISRSHICSKAAQA